MSQNTLSLGWYILPFKVISGLIEPTGWWVQISDFLLFHLTLKFQSESHLSQKGQQILWSEIWAEEEGNIMVNRSWLFRILASGKHAVNLLALRKEDTAKLILHTRRGHAGLTNTVWKWGEVKACLSLVLMVKCYKLFICMCVCVSVFSYQNGGTKQISRNNLKNIG